MLHITKSLVRFSTPVYTVYLKPNISVCVLMDVVFLLCEKGK